MKLGTPPSPNRKGHPFVGSLSFQGIPVDIENAKGDVRTGVDKDGHRWRSVMHAHYGEFRNGVRGEDGDKIDVYVGPDAESKLVVIVNQNDPVTGKHDEQKCMLGFATVADALALYDKQYDRPGFRGKHVVMTLDKFRSKIVDKKYDGQALAKAFETFATLMCPQDLSVTSAIAPQCDRLALMGPPDNVASAEPSMAGHDAAFDDAGFDDLMRWQADEAADDAANVGAEQTGVPFVSESELQAANGSVVVDTRPTADISVIGRIIQDDAGDLWAPMDTAVAEMMLMFGLAKGLSHKYIKRVPTGAPKGKPQWRYYYKVTAKGGLHNGEFAVGASFADAKIGDHKGHWHVVEHEPGKMIKIRHDETKEEKSFPYLYQNNPERQLSNFVHGLHVTEIVKENKEKQAKAKAEFAEAAQHGSKKTVERARERASRLGVPAKDMMTEPEKKAAEQAEQDFIARREDPSYRNRPTEPTATKPVEIAPAEKKDLTADQMAARGFVWHEALNTKGVKVGYWVLPATVKLVEARGNKWRDDSAPASAQKDPFKRWKMKRFDGVPYPYEVPISAVTPGDAFDYADVGIHVITKAWMKGPDGSWVEAPLTFKPGPDRNSQYTASSMADIRMGERPKTGGVFNGRIDHSKISIKTLHANGWIWVPNGIDPNTEGRSHTEIIRAIFDKQKSDVEAAAAQVAKQLTDRQEALQKHQESAWDGYRWPDGAPVPDNAQHPRIMPSLRDSRFQVWTWDANIGEYRKANRPPDSGSWLQSRHEDEYEWQKAAREHPGSIFVPAGEVPIYPRLDAPRDVIQLGVSVERPPDFLALNMANIATEEVRSGGYTNHVAAGAEPWLHEHGFWDALDKSQGHNGFLAKVLIDKNKRGASYQDTRSDKVRGFIAQGARNLAAWWSDINDDEREYFVEHFCDDNRQPKVVRPNDARQNNADLTLPPGMEKFAAKGWKLHEYQRKAVNFAADHAKRALLAMEMGLGKSLSSIALYHHLKARGEVKRMVITAPSSAIGTWEDEFKGNSDARVRIIAGATAKERDAAFEAFRKHEVDVLVMTPYTLGLPVVGDKVKPTKAVLSRAPDGATVFTGGVDYRRRSMWTREGDKWTTSDWGEKKSLSTEELAKEKPTVHINAGPSTDWVVSDLDAMKLRRIIQDAPNETLRIADEVHLFKSTDSARRRGFEHAMCEPEGRVVGLSGTPKPNGPEDFHTIVNDITRGALGSTLAEFANRYCYVQPDAQYGSGILGFRPDALSDLYRDNAGFMFARTTQDPDAKLNLPPQNHLSPRLKPDGVQNELQAALVKTMGILHQALREERAARAQGAEEFVSPARYILDEMADGRHGHILKLAARKVPWDERSLLTRLKQASIAPSILDDDGSVTGQDGPLSGYESPKMQAVADAATTHMGQNPDTGAVLFSTSVGGLYAMQAALVRRGVSPDDIGIIHGGVKLKDREVIRRALNDGKLKYVIGQTKALNTGANMQARANFVAHIDTPWEPDVLTQSTARVHRQGQARKVTVFRPVGSDVDALIERRVAGKLRANANALGVTMDSDKVALESMVGRGLNDSQFTDALATMLGVSVETLKPQGERVMTGMADILKKKPGQIDEDDQ